MNPALYSWIDTAAGLVGWASASAAVLILGAWMMQKALGRKLSLSWRSALGWLVVARLVCLVAPESRWSWRNWVVTGHWSSVVGHWSLSSAVPSTGAVEPVIRLEPDQSGDEPSGQPRVDSASSLSSPHQSLTPEHDEVRLEATQEHDALPLTHEHDEVRLEPEQSGDRRRQPLTTLPSRASAAVVPWVALLWWVGTCGSFGMVLARHFIFWRKVRLFSRPLPAGSEAGRWLEESRQLLQVRPRVQLRTLAGLGSPVVFGFFRPSILLPPEVAKGLTAWEARHIFLHELAHIRCGDVLANWLLIATRALHWFNPLVWIALRQIVADRELVRDAMALRALPGGDSARREYGHTLLRLATTLSRPRLSPGLASLIHTEKEIQRRIAMIKTPLESNRRLWPQALAGALALALVAVTFTAAARGQASVAETGSADTKPAASPAEATAAIAADPFADPAANFADVDTFAAVEFRSLAAVETAEPLFIDQATSPVEEGRIQFTDAVVSSGEGVRPNRLKANEKRLAQLDDEIAKMTEAGRKQETEVLTSLRGELLKEIYRAKYLAPAEEPAAARKQYGIEKKPMRLAPDAAAPARELPQRDKARFEESAPAEVRALRQQIEDMAREIEALKQHLTKTNAYQDALQRDLQTKNEKTDYRSLVESLKGRGTGDPFEATARHKDAKEAALHASLLADQAKLMSLEQSGQGPNHPSILSLKAKIDAEKRMIDDAARNSFRAKEKKFEKPALPLEPKADDVLATPGAAPSPVPPPERTPPTEPKPTEPAR